MVSELDEFGAVYLHSKNVQIVLLANGRLSVALHQNPFAIGREARVGIATILVGDDKGLFAEFIVNKPDFAHTVRRVANAKELGPFNRPGVETLAAGGKGSILKRI